MPNGDEAVVGVDDPKMEGDVAAVEVAPPPKIDPNVREIPQSGKQFQPKGGRFNAVILVYEALSQILMNEGLIIP